MPEASTRPPWRLRRRFSVSSRPPGDEEREFWAENGVVDFFDWDSSGRGSFPALKPSTGTISLRLPQGLLDKLKAVANERDVPYQILLRVLLAERVAREGIARLDNAILTNGDCY